MVSFFGYDFAVSELTALAVSVFLAVFYAIKTGSVKNLIKEVTELMYKFRTMQTVAPSEGQTFSEEKDEYRLNEITNELEKTGNKINIQAIIDSCLETALDKALSRLMPEVEECKEMVELETMRGDLDVMQEAAMLAEEYRAKYGLSEDIPYNNIFAKVGEMATALDSKIKDAQKPKQEESNNVSEETNAQGE